MEEVEDPPRILPIQFTCEGCGKDVLMDYRPAKEIMEDGRTVEIHAEVECPECGEPYTQVTDCRDDPLPRAEDLLPPDDAEIPVIEFPDDANLPWEEET